jgi:K+-sensing histidine kinase KdpD
MLANLLTIAAKGATDMQADINAIFQYIDAPDLLRSEHGRCAVADLPSIIADIASDLNIATIHVQDSPVWTLDTCDLAISRHGSQLIFSELFENARTFHPHRNPVIEISIMIRHTVIELHVRDDGRAISSDQLAQVWLPYDQDEGFFTGQAPRMGMGLPMVACLLWRIGGSCRISNRTPGPGVDVEMCIPFTEPS